MDIIQVKVQENARIAIIDVRYIETSDEGSPDSISNDRQKVGRNPKDKFLSLDEVRKNAYLHIYSRGRARKNARSKTPETICRIEAKY